MKAPCWWVDATQGIEAQTLANLYLALESDLVVIPVINKIDLPSARPDEVAHDLGNLLGEPEDEIVRISAKEGTNVEQVLEKIVQKVPPPSNDEQMPLRALIFDSHYDSYKGVVAYLRVIEGRIRANEALRLMITGVDIKPVEIGFFAPGMRPVEVLNTGDVGYIASGLKTVKECRVGDTITSVFQPRGSSPARGIRRQNRWFSLEFTRWKGKITRNCGTRWINCS